MNSFVYFALSLAQDKDYIETTQDLKPPCQRGLRDLETYSVRLYGSIPSHSTQIAPIVAV